MAETNDNDQTDDQVDDNTSTGGTLKEDFEKAVAAAVEERLAKIKASMDALDKKYSEAIKENVKLKTSQSDSKQAQLRSEGKELEAEKLKRVELEEELAHYKEKLVSVTRDKELDTALNSLEFRSSFARAQAADWISKDLVLDKDGTWVHRTGADINAYVKTLTKNDDFSATFLKPKENSGANTSNARSGSNNQQKPKSLVGLSGAELIALAEKGMLGEYR